MSCGNFNWNSTRHNWIERDLGPVPRTCSFCGGVNLDDAFILIDMYNWRIEFTDKRYKFYLINVNYDDSPPVKVYTNHMSPTHIRRFNECIDKQRGLT